MPRSISCLFADTLVLVSAFLGLCFVIAPELAFKYNSYYLYRFVPYWAWATIYFGLASIGWYAIYRHHLKAWSYFSYGAVAMFALSTLNFLIAYLIASGQPTAIFVHFSLFLRAFSYCRSPYYWLTIVEVAGGKRAPDHS